MWSVFVILGLLCLLLDSARAANILAMVVVASHSHHLWNSKYLEALADRGHTITYLGIDEYKNPHKNVRHIYIEGMYELLYSDTDFDDIAEVGAYTSMGLMTSGWDNKTITRLLETKAFASFMDTLKREKFDLIIDDLCMTVFLLGAAGLQNYPPIVGVTAFGVPPWVLQMAGNPLPFTDSPHFFLPYSKEMSFLERLDNFLLYYYSNYEMQRLIEKQNTISRQVFGEETLHLNQIIDKINVVLVNANPATDHPFPMVPGVIPVGGLHIQKVKPLSQELQEYLDTAPAGVIYFSLGSNVQSSTLEEDKINILKEAFRQLAPVRVLWKWEVDEMPGKPDNVKVSKWLPQNDILAHPKVRMFFTHSGLLSTQEALYHAVPLVAMPFFLDQHVNSRRCTTLGIAQQLDYNTLSVLKVVDAIKTVIENPSYKSNAKRLSAIFRDGATKPLDLAVHWTEYALRHDGAAHLRPASRSLSWYQTGLLDITFTLLLFIVFSLLLIFKSTCFFYSFIRSCKVKTD